MDWKGYNYCSQLCRFLSQEVREKRGALVAPPRPFHLSVWATFRRQFWIVTHLKKCSWSNASQHVTANVACLKGRSDNFTAFMVPLTLDSVTWEIRGKSWKWNVANDGKSCVNSTVNAAKLSPCPFAPAHIICNVLAGITPRTFLQIVEGCTVFFHSVIDLLPFKPQRCLWYLNTLPGYVASRVSTFLAPFLARKGSLDLNIPVATDRQPIRIVKRVDTRRSSAAEELKRGQGELQGPSKHGHILKEFLVDWKSDKIVLYVIEMYIYKKAFSLFLTFKFRVYRGAQNCDMISCKEGCEILATKDTSLHTLMYRTFCPSKWFFNESVVTGVQCTVH